MSTCGDCKFFIGGRCKDVNTVTGTAADFEVDSASGICSDGDLKNGWQGFKPKEQVIPAEKRQVFELIRRCGTCDKFKGPGKKCGETYEQGGKQHPYNPMNAEVGPCQNGWVEKRIILRDHQELLKDIIWKPKITPGKFEATPNGIGIFFDSSGSMGREMLEELRAANPIKTKYYVNSTKKETGNMNAIIRLADSQLNKQIEDFGGLQLNIREALETLQAEEQKQASHAAAKEVMEYLKNANVAVEFQVKEIRRARRIEEAAKKSIEQFNRAKAYGLETNNFIPLGILMGQIYEHHVENKDLLKVPEGWNPKKEQTGPVGQRLREQAE